MATPSTMPTTIESAKPIRVVASVKLALCMIGPHDPTMVWKTRLGRGSRNFSIEKATQTSSHSASAATVTTTGAAMKISRSRCNALLLDVDFALRLGRVVAVGED